jgi:hypothetical protein
MLTYVVLLLLFAGASVTVRDPAQPAFVNETDATMQYFFTWNHVAACEGAGGGGGLDVGWILIIVYVM